MDAGTVLLRLALLFIAARIAAEIAELSFEGRLGGWRPTRRWRRTTAKEPVT